MKNKTYSRVLAIVLAVLSILTTAIPAFAEDVQIYTYDGNDIISSVNVTATISDGNDVYDPENPNADDNGYVNGDIQVGVPTSIVINSTPNADGYYIGSASGKVKGNISGATIINVIPDEEVTLSTEGKADVTAPVEQDYTKFVVSTSEYGGSKVNKHVTPDFNDNAVFEVSVKTKDLSAGSWAGSFNYNISVSNTATTPEGNRIRSWNVSDSDDDSVWMTYYQPEGVAATTTHVENADGSSSDIEKYSNGTVVIRGTGKMQEGLNKNFYDIDAMNVYAHEKYWANLNDNLTDEEYNTLVDAVGVGAKLYEFVSSTSISYTDVYDSLSPEIRKIANKGHFGADPNEVAMFKTFVPKAIIIEDGITNVSSSAFAYCDSVESVVIPDSVTSIEHAAFANCRKLANINIPATVTTFGSFAFNGCVKITEISLGANVTRVEQMAFDNMTATIHCPTQAIADMITNSNSSSTSAQPTLIVG